MPAIYLSEEDVLELMDMESAIEIVEESFRRMANDQAMNIPRQRAKATGILLHTMSAAADYLRVVGGKTYTTTKHGARFHVTLYDAASGEMLAIIEANALGQFRTGAASGVATQYLARPDAKIVGLFGAGFQARAQLKAVCSVRRIERVEVYCKDADRRTLFADEMSEFCGTEVVPVHAPNDAAEEKDIVITATSSKTPVFDGRVLEVGTHLNVIGSNFRNKAEVDVLTVQSANTIVCDSLEQCRIEAGDLIQAVEAGAADWVLMKELGSVILGNETGRAVPENITLFKSVGLAIEDIALGAAILERARSAGYGQPLPF